MKNFIANIPFMISVPFQLVAKLCSYIIMKLIELGGKLHIRWRTPLGLRLIEAEQQAKEVAQALSDLKATANKLAMKHKAKSDSTLSDIITKGRKNDPTFH